ncbi:MAG: MmgE/PrpD family protein [Vicinamibacterales bacterium]
MSSTTLAGFIVGAAPPDDARAAAARAVLDTVGVTLAGSVEPAAQIVQRVIADEGAGPCTVIGHSVGASAPDAALANGTAAHALDFDDMCFVSLAHPSAPLVAAAFAAAERAGATGRALLDAYVVGFEIESRLGRALNPRHYQRGWHCTSTIGTLGAAAAAARLLGLDRGAAGHALAIAASEACGLKENFGTMVKPLHAGLAARNGVLAARLAQAGMTASGAALEGPQGYLAAMDAEWPTLEAFVGDLGARWEIVDTGITLKLYPSCAGTHPTLDAILDLTRREGFAADQVESIAVGVDGITPTVLIYDRPSSGLEAKFSMPFCVAAAVVHGHVGVDTFDAETLGDPRMAAFQSRVVMEVDPTLDPSAPALTQARVRVRLTDGRELVASANGARGYPERPATDDELEGKFRTCAERVLSPRDAARALAAVRGIDGASDVRAIAGLLQA